MRLAKILMIALCALALGGCFSYYSPGHGPVGASFYSQDEYYGEEEYYDDGTPIVDLRVINASYYPWWSLDYYYFGPHYYRPAYFGYASGWYSSLGYNFSYPPYYRPYGFYGPFYPYYPHYTWYDPWYGWPGYGLGVNYIWYDTYWTRRYRDYARDHHPQPAPVDYGNASYDFDDPRRGVYRDPRDRAPAAFQSRDPDVAGPTSRSKSIASSGAKSDKGMSVRSRRDRKVRESHIGPAPVQSRSATSGPARSISVVPGHANPTAPAAPAASAPGMIRQVQPSQARPVAPSRSANPPTPRSSMPRPIRQATPPTARPGAARPAVPPARSVPARPSRGPSPSDSGSPSYSSSDSRRRN